MRKEPLACYLNLFEYLAVMKRPFEPLIWGESHAGLVRPVNEDRVFPHGVWPEPFDISYQLVANRGWLLAVADGVFRSAHGDKASETAISSLVSAYYDQSLPAALPVNTRLMYAAQTANVAVCDLANGLPGGKTTLVAAAIHDGRAWIVHAGDSRAYLVRSRTTTPLTQDHTIAQDLLNTGVITCGAADAHPERGRLTRVLGRTRDLKYDLCGPVRLRSEDRLLLCSDGLSSLVTPDEITKIVADRSLREAVRSLIDIANERGGYDNVSIVITGPFGRIRLVEWYWVLRSWITHLKNNIRKQ